MGGAAVAGVALAQPLLRRAIHGLQTVSRVVDRVNWDHLLAGRALDRDVPRFVIPSFLDTDPPGRGSTPAALRAFLDQLPSEPFIMFAGALRRIKGVDVLLEAYASLAEPRPPLVLMGTRHEDTPTVLPPGARIFESVPHDAVMASWARALVGVVPSVWPEPNATVSFECASQGVPVIVSEPSGMVDAFGDGAGLTVPAGSVQALANALRTVIDDPALRRRLGEAAKEASARFQADVVLAEQEHALATVLAGAGRRG
jgi:glycosyltransferase involved in cell wall biosynthesis